MANEPIMRIGDPQPTVSTTNQLFASDRSQKREGNLSALLFGASTVIGGWKAATLFRDKYTTTNPNYFTFFDFASRTNAGAKESIPDDTFIGLKNNRFTGGDVILETIRKAEEYSPGKVGRTFQLSHLLTPFLGSKNTRMHLDAQNVKAQYNVLKPLIDKAGNMPLSDDALKHGLVFEDNKLFQADKFGQAIKDKKYLNEARLVFPYYKVPTYDSETGKIKDTLSINDVYKNYINARTGAKLDIDATLKDGGMPFTIIGEKTAGKLNYEYGFRALARTAMQRGVKVWDHPMGFLEEYMPANSKLKEYVGKFRFNLGTKGRYDLGVRETLGVMTKNVGTRLALGGIAYYGLDSIVRNVAPDDNYFSNGIIAGLAQTYANIRTGYASLVSDHFQGLRDTQEQIAPGSTSLTTLAGLPASFALAGGMAAYSKFLWDANKTNYTSAITSAIDKKPLFGKLGGMFAGGRLKRFTVGGALLGLAIEAPFIPGALLTGDTSEELKAEYSGEKEVPVYANRWWMGGGGPWEGGKIKYFRPSTVALLKNDIETVSMFGDSETARSVNPFLHPFDYLRDPYRAEKLTDDDRPYPIWGMDVSTASFIGKAYERTIGQIIKPDKLNPAFEAALNSGRIKENDDGSYSYVTEVTAGDASLIAEGKMLPPPSARDDSNIEAAKWSYDALKDFIGIKGFVLDQLESGFGADLDTLGDVQLAKSGQMSNDAREIAELNLGGILGLGEAQRRFIPTNSGAIGNTVNPLENNMPSWLPSNTADFYIDFRKGDPYKAIDVGYARLPGKGYEILNPDVQGLDPEDYPDIYKYKILADVALGSNEYYKIKKQSDNRFSSGAMSESEASLYLRIKDQENKRAQTKQFYEYKTNEELDKMNPLAAGAAQYWELLTHGPLSEAPYEKLSIVRPTSKFIHQRTAIEDYEATQLDNADSGMWDKPIEHYISPALTQIARGLGFDYIPDKTEERYQVDEYFDKLEYLKNRTLYKQKLSEGSAGEAQGFKRAYGKTIQGSLASGLDNERDILYSFIALPKRERDYFTSFINADQEQREKIRELVPDRIGALYEELWSRKDILAQYYDPDTGTINQDKAQQAIQAQAASEEDTLESEYSSEYNNYKNNNQLQAQGSFKEYIADLDAQQYIENTTGMPDKDFVGWDPRIDVKDIKLRALSIGGEDLYEYGFFKTDLESLKRVIAVLNEEQVTTEIDAVKKQKQDKGALEERIRTNLIQNNLDPKMIELVKTNSEGSLTVNVEETQ